MPPRSEHQIATPSSPLQSEAPEKFQAASAPQILWTCESEYQGLRRTQYYCCLWNKCQVDAPLALPELPRLQLGQVGNGLGDVTCVYVKFLHHIMQQTKQISKSNSINCGDLTELQRRRPRRCRSSLFKKGPLFFLILWLKKGTTHHERTHFSVSKIRR